MIDDPVNYSPYCPICDACGEDGCCSALSCQQHPDGDYCEGYLEELKISYRMNRFFQEKIYPHLTDEWQTLYDEQWDEEYERSRKGADLDPKTVTRARKNSAGRPALVPSLKKYKVKQ